MLATLLSELQWWHWLVLAMLLFIIEITAPVTWFLWVGVAAAFMALIAYFMPHITWQMQLLLFGALGVASLFAGHQWFQRRPIQSDHPQLNRRGEQYVGRTFTLTEKIENGVGTVHVDDTRWRVNGPELAAGQIVRVIDIDGTTLLVEAAAG